MPVKININPYLQQKIENAAEKAIWATTEEILADCQKYVKEDQGTLRDSAQIKSEPGKGIIVWDTPYAKRQYWEIKTSLTPGRTWKWCETAKLKHGKRWQGLIQKAIKKFL